MSRFSLFPGAIEKDMSGSLSRYACATVMTGRWGSFRFAVALDVFSLPPSACGDAYRPVPGETCVHDTTKENESTDTAGAGTSGYGEGARGMRSDINIPGTLISLPDKLTCSARPVGMNIRTLIR